MKHIFAAVAAVVMAASATAMAAGPSSTTVPTQITAKLKLDSNHYLPETSRKPTICNAVLTITNPTTEPQKYMQGGLGVDWEIEDTKGNVLYNSQYGKRVPHYIRMMTLDAGAHISFEGTIPLQSNTDEPLPQGYYTLRARLGAGSDVQATKNFYVE